MEHSRFQVSVAGMLIVVACVALNVWLFRVGILWGIVGLNVTKHVVIAYVCRVVGVDRSRDAPGAGCAEGVVGSQPSGPPISSAP